MYPQVLFRAFRRLGDIRPCQVLNARLGCGGISLASSLRKVEKSMLIDYPWRRAVRRDLDRAHRRLGATGIEVRTACASTSIIRARRTFSPRVLVFDVPAPPRRCNVLSEARERILRILFRKWHSPRVRWASMASPPLFPPFERRSIRARLLLREIAAIVALPRQTFTFA